MSKINIKDAKSAYRIDKPLLLCDSNSADLLYDATPHFSEKPPLEFDFREIGVILTNWNPRIVAILRFMA